MTVPVKVALQDTLKLTITVPVPVDVLVPCIGMVSVMGLVMGAVTLRVASTVTVSLRMNKG